MVETLTRDEYVAALAQEALDVPEPAFASSSQDVPGQQGASSTEEPPRPALLDLWELRSLADAYKPRPPRVYAVPGILAQETLNIVFGAPGSLKSMLLADLALCVASGSQWLPLMNKPGTGHACTQSPVLWIDLDNGKRRSDERFDALGHARHLPADVPLRYVTIPSPWLDASNGQLMAQVIELTQYLKAKVVIIDNLGAILGPVKENDGEMATVMANLRRLSEATGAAVVVIHHQRKHNGAAVRKGETLRGHSSIEAALDLALHVDRKEGTDEVVVTPVKMRDQRFAPFGALFTYQLREGGTELAQAHFYGRAIEGVTADEKVDQIVLDILRRKGEMNKGTLRDAGKDQLPEAGINRISGRINALVASGQIASRDGYKNEVLLSLPQTHDLRCLTETYDAGCKSGSLITLDL